MQSLDITRCVKQAETRQAFRNEVDDLISRTLPLVPFLQELRINDFQNTAAYAEDRIALSRRTWTLLKECSSLQTLKGILWRLEVEESDERFVSLLNGLPHLRSLDLRGAGFLDHTTLLDHLQDAEEPNPTPLEFPSLHTLTIISVPTCSFIRSLLITPLPSLTTLTLTPFNDLLLPLSHFMELLEVHGRTLKKLSLITPRAMGESAYQCPHLSQILHLCPELRWLELESPFSPLPSTSAQPLLNHPLRLLTFPRPTSSFLTGMLEPLLTTHVLSQLGVVRLRDAKWLAKAYGKAAGETGVQGEMRTWKRRLGRWRVRLVDCAWNEGDV